MIISVFYSFVPLCLCVYFFEFCVSVKSGIANSTLIHDAKIQQYSGAKTRKGDLRILMAN